MTTTEMQHNALSRAQGCRSGANMMIVFTAFQQRGIALNDIEPGVNVLTFHAWKALGRSVKKGEKGISLVTWVPCGVPKEGEPQHVRPKTAYVFHISQTVAIVDKPKTQVPAPLADWMKEGVTA